ncbi:metallophosphoesterase [Cohnella sp. JJ-181]|uniref:metallophosphoesterase n=1 Tax=Cohnella rhizoplanae TaxID=2974897 RepID=UPI0022FF6B9D|nr:metallophosphoesterase [Cohnella sp. JJ-181]CAI6087271.1 Serine/threonine-protein phosphatase 1 [Cohnella sp. JJ-181]
MNKTRTLAISDIHGCAEQLKRLLAKCRFDARCDRLVLLGDYVDRGPGSRQAVALVRRLVRESGAIALQGNHDRRFVRVMQGRAHPAEILKFFEKGGAEAIGSYLGAGHASRIVPERVSEYRARIMAGCEDHIRFLEHLPYYYEDDHFIYVHAGLNPEIQDWRQQSVMDYLFIREAFYKHPVTAGKTVVFGHTKAIELHDKPDVWFGGDKIGIDGGCSYGYQLNALEIVDGAVTRVYVEPGTRTSRAAAGRRSR